MFDPCAPIHHTIAVLKAWRVWRLAHPNWVQTTVVSPCLKAAVVIGAAGGLPGNVMLPPMGGSTLYGPPELYGPPYLPGTGFPGYGGAFFPGGGYLGASGGRGYGGVAGGYGGASGGSAGASLFSPSVVSALPGLIGYTPYMTPAPVGAMMATNDTPPRIVPPIIDMPSGSTSVSPPVSMTPPGSSTDQPPVQPPTNVPEPSSLLVMASATVALLFRRLRRKA